MPETVVIVDKFRITYEGLFNFYDFYKFLTTFLEEKGYEKFEKKNIESISEDGKYIELLLLPYKKITDYAQSKFQIQIVISNMKDVFIEKDGVKVKTNQGKMQIIFDAWMLTDYEDRWEKKPGLFFVRLLFDKYFYKPFTVSYEAEVKSDYDQMVSQVRAFLNMSRLLK
jgi:hypothetical protein